MGKNFEAHGVDLDPEPIAYGHRTHFEKLTEQQKNQLQIHKANVLDPELPPADLIAAMNFSYFIFKDRKVLKSYFANCLHGLKENGVLVVDCFGGSQCYEALEEETEYEDFSYFWDLDSFDPITNQVMYYIHFKLKNEKEKREKCFTYDWRMWSIPEIKDIMEEVGFNHVHVYWEGTTADGEGDGNFVKATKGEECEAWIAYIVAEK